MEDAADAFTKPKRFIIQIKKRGLPYSVFTQTAARFFFIAKKSF